jgi:predicted nucleic acid-binding protein
MKRSSRSSTGTEMRHDGLQISFTDLISMIMMEERDIHQVLTGNEHFVQVGMGLPKVP